MAKRTTKSLVLANPAVNASLAVPSAVASQMLAAQNDALLKQKMIRVAIDDALKVINPRIASLHSALTDQKQRLADHLAERTEALAALAKSTAESLLTPICDQLNSLFKTNPSKPICTISGKAALTTTKGEEIDDDGTEATTLTITSSIDFTSDSPITRRNYYSSDAALTKSSTIPLTPFLTSSLRHERMIRASIASLEADVSRLQQKKSELLLSAPKMELELDRRMILSNEDASTQLASITSHLMSSLGLNPDTANEYDARKRV